VDPPYISLEEEETEEEEEQETEEEEKEEEGVLRRSVTTCVLAWEMGDGRGQLSSLMWSRALSVWLSVCLSVWLSVCMCYSKCFRCLRSC
jgi:hypothetical protein